MEERISVANVFAESFRLWKQNLLTILSIGLVVYLPAQVLIEIASFLSDKFFPVTDLNSAKLLTQIYDIIRYLLGAVAFLSIVFLSYSRIKDPAREFTTFELLMHGLRRWGRYIVTGLFAGIIVFLRFLLLIVPGIIKGVRLSLFDCLVATQETTPEAACARSEELVIGKSWLVFGFTILVFALEFALEIIFAFVFYSSLESSIPSIIIGVAIKLLETYFIVSKTVLFYELEKRSTIGAA